MLLLKGIDVNLPASWAVYHCFDRKVMIFKSSAEKTLLCLPGFLGTPTDFQFLQALPCRVSCLDICGSDSPSAGESWEEWENRVLKESGIIDQEKSLVLIGYSMGARIALSMLAKNLKCIKGAVLLSCHPGLTNSEERVEREKNDQIWAERFRKECWNSVFEAWNSQPVLSTSSFVSRNETNYERAKLAQVLETFSLSRQKRLEENSIEAPALVCWGQKDVKFKDLAKPLAATFRHAQLLEIPAAGHRINKDNPAYLFEKIREYVGRC
jgi:2-succinyl-6-hydroxy-2,4-cyclohexadiene-1-carboxylate synthase